MINEAIRAAYRVGNSATEARRYAAQGYELAAAQAAKEAASWARVLSALRQDVVVSAHATFRELVSVSDERDNQAALDVLNREIWRRHVHGAEVL